MAAGQKLTKRLVESLRPEHGVDLLVWDTDVTGFGIRVKPSGVRSFVFRYRPPTGGNDRKATIGRYPGISVEAAREQARELYAQRCKGVDPALERQRARSAKSLREMADYYLSQHAQLKGNREVTLAEYRRTLNKHLLPKFGNRKLDQFTRADLTDLMHSLATTPVAANRLRAVISGMYAAAINLGWATMNPCKGVACYRERPRERYLSTDDQKELLNYLGKHSNQDAADVVRLLLLTGARRGEVLKATWEMFDLKGRVWIKPSHHTKQDREHVVGLPPAAIAVIERRFRQIGTRSKFIFPQKADPTRPIVGIKKFWARLQKDLGLHGLRVHDLRHTSASVLISAGHTLAEVGSVLGHTQSRTTERYAHLLDENKHRSAATLQAVFGHATEPASSERCGSADSNKSRLLSELSQGVLVAA